MKISKTRDVKTPDRGTKGSAGIDFYVPNDFGTKVILPGEHIIVKSGIKANVPEGMALIGFNKSGIAISRRLQIGACVIDSDYQGEIHLHLFNTGNVAVEVESGDKLAQFLLIPVDHCKIVLLPESHLYKSKTTRGTGGFGHTGSK